MKNYIGVKQIKAVKMSLGEYNTLRGGDIPKDEEPTREGYKVEYEDGYISWSPKEAFESAYRQTDTLPFGLVIEALKLGKKVSRSRWNGKVMFLYLVPGSSFNVNSPPLLGIYQEGTEIVYNPYMELVTANGSVSTWSPSGSDALAEDWIILD